MSLLCVGGILLAVDLQELWSVLERTQPLWLLLGFLALGLSLGFRALRWRLLLSGNAAWLKVFHIQNIGYLLMQILPFRIGDVVRAVLVGNLPSLTVARGLSTVVVERTLDVLVIVAIFPFSITAVEGLPEAAKTAALVTGMAGLFFLGALVMAARSRPRIVEWAGGAMGGVGISNPSPWKERLDELLLGLNGLTRWRSGVSLAALSLLVWFPVVLAYWLGLQSVGVAVGPAAAAFMVCAGAFSIAVPSAPSGAGTFHAGAMAAVVLLGQTESTALAAAVVVHLLGVVTSVLFGLAGIAGTGTTLGETIRSAKTLRRDSQPEADPTGDG